MFLLLILPIALLLLKQRQEIRKRAAANDITVTLGSNSVAPGASTISSVNITPGSTAIYSAEISLVYDSSKITVNGFGCNLQKFTSEIAKDTTAGNMFVKCRKTGGGGITGEPFAAVNFTVVAGSSTGQATISLGQATKILNVDGDIITSQKNPAVLNIGTVSGQNPVFFSFGSSAVSPGGSTSGAVKITLTSTPIFSSRIIFTYDSSRVNISNVACKDLPNKPVDPTISNGTVEVACQITNEGVGLSGGTFELATFNISVLSGAATGQSNFSFTSNSRVSDHIGSTVGIQTSNNSIQVTAGGATPTPAPGGITVNPGCVAPGGSVTISGSGFGTTQGRVVFNTTGLGFCNNDDDLRWGSCGHAGTINSWSNTQIVVNVPTNVSGNGVNVVIQKSGSTTPPVYLSPVPTINVSTSCPTPTPRITPTPTATPTRAPTPTPTITVDPNRPGVFSLEPDSTTVGANPVLVEIKLNSGTKKVNSAQVVINVDPKLSVVDSSGNAVTEILPGSTVLTGVQINRFTSGKITYLAGKASGSTAAASVNGTLAKFYVKTAQTSGTAQLSFVTTGGGLPDRAYILDDNSVNVLGRADTLTLSLGTSTQGVTISNLRHAINPTPMPSPAVQVPYVAVSFDTNVQTVASWVLTLPNGDRLCPPEAPSSLGCDTTVDSFRHTTPATSHSFVAGNLIPGNYKYTVYAAVSGNANSVVSRNSADPAFTVVAGDTFTFKLKFKNIDNKPTTPNITGLDYGHESARVIVKSLDNKLVLTKEGVVLTAGDGGVYTSAPIDISTLSAGKYNLHVKPVGYFQKRFAAINISAAGVVDLTQSGYRFEPGDLNNDSKVNLVDFNDITNFIEGISFDLQNVAFTAQQYKKYDLDRDGKLHTGSDMELVRETLLTRYDDE